MEKESALSEKLEKLRQLAEKQLSEKKFEEYQNASVNDVKALIH